MILLGLCDLIFLFPLVVVLLVLLALVLLALALLALVPWPSPPESTDHVLYSLPYSVWFA